MPTAGELDIVVKLKSQIARDLAPVRQSLRGLAEDIELGIRPTKLVSNLFGGLGRTIFSTTGIIIGAASAVAGLAYLIKQSIPATTEFGLAIGGLESVAIKFGHSADAATEAAMRLSRDGLITPRTAAEGLKRLLITGLGLPEATKLMKAYLDMAAFGRSSMIDMNQAILNLSQSFVTERSMLADNSGMYENYKEVIEAGARAIGRKASELTYAERVTAKYIGTLMVATRAEGDAERLSMTYAGTMSKLSNAMYMLKVVIGALVIPALNKLAGWLTVVLQAAAALIGRLAPGWIRVGMDMVKGSSLGVGAVSDLRKQFDELGGKVADTARKIKRAMEDFAHDTKRALQDFRRRLADLVYSHRDKVVQLKKQLDEERRNLQERIDKMREPYEELKKNAIQAGKERLADLRVQLDKEVAKGRYANQEKVAMLRAFIAEEEAAIQKSISEWDAKAQEEIAIEVAKGQERISEIERELQEEEAVLQRHAGIIATIKDMQREDDIARLVRQYGEETAERERQHQLRLESMRETGAMEGGAMGAAFKDAIGGEMAGLSTSLGEALTRAFQNIQIDKARVASLLVAGIGAVIASIVGAALIQGLIMAIAGAAGMIAAAFVAVLAGVGLGYIIYRWVSSHWASITEAGRRIAGGIGDAIRNFLATLRLPRIGIRWTDIMPGPGVFNIPTGIYFYQKGGIVPGKIGEPKLAVVHAGERIIPAGRQGSEVSQTFNVTVQSPWDFQLMMERAAIMARRGIG